MVTVPGEYVFTPFKSATPQLVCLIMELDIPTILRPKPEIIGTTSSMNVAHIRSICAYSSRSELSVAPDGGKPYARREKKPFREHPGFRSEINSFVGIGADNRRQEHIQV